MRATQLKSALHLQEYRGPTWMVHTEFTLRPRSARTGVVGHDNLGWRLRRPYRKGLRPVMAFHTARTIMAPITATSVETMKP